MESKIRLIVAETRALFRESFSTLLFSCQDFTVMCDVASSSSLTEALATKTTDIVLLDSDLIFDFFKHFRPHQNKNLLPKIILIGEDEDHEVVDQILSVNACAYISRKLDFSICYEIIRRAHSHGHCFSHKAFQKIGDMARTKSYSLKQKQLSKREHEIAELLVGGKIEKEISALLTIAENTVHAHRKNIYRKTGSHNSTDLTNYMYRSSRD